MTNEDALRLRPGETVVHDKSGVRCEVVKATQTVKPDLVVVEVRYLEPAPDRLRGGAFDCRALRQSLRDYEQEA